MLNKILNLKNLILFFLSVLILVPPFFSGGRHSVIHSGWLIVVGLILIFFVLFSRDNPHPTKKNFFLSPYFFWGIFLLFYFVSASQSVALYQSGLELLQLIAYAVIFVVVSKLSLLPQERNRIFFLFIVTAFILSLVGFYFYLTGGYYRLTSTFYWANPFAGYLLLILPLAIGFFYSQRLSRFYRISSLIILPILLSALFLTQSRGAGLILLLVALIFLSLFVKKIRKVKIGWIAPVLTIAIILTILILVVKFGNPISGQNQAAKLGLETSFKTRLNFWKGGLEMFLAKPLFGFGPGTFGFVYPSYQKDALSVTKYAHNYFIQMLAEGGSVATLAFLSIFVMIFWFGWWRNKNRLNDEVTIGLVVGLIASLLHNFIDFDWYFYANFLSFWVLAGLLYGSSYQENDNDYVSKKLTIIVSLVVVLVLILGGVIGLRANYLFQKAEKQVDPDKAEPFYHQSLFLNPNPDYYAQLSNLLLAKFLQGQNENEAKLAISEADVYIDKAIHFNNYQPYYYQLKAVINYVQQKPEIAEQSLLKAVSLDPVNRPTIYLDLISFYLTSNKLDKAEQFATKILSKYPDGIINHQDWKIMANQTSVTDTRANISMIYYLRGLAREKKGALEEARGDFRKALAIDQNNKLANIELEKLK